MKIFFWIVLLFLASCSNKKNIEQVFDESEPLQKASCAEQALRDRFIVLWEDKTISLVQAENAEDFKHNFLQKNLQNIKMASYDYKIKQLDNVLLRSNTAHSSSENTHWAADLIQAPQLWQKNITGLGVTVAIIDSYVDIHHSQLKNNIYINPNESINGQDDDQNGFIDDINGIHLVQNASVGNHHGTHVAGIVAADSRLGEAIGIAPQATILPAVFLEDDGGGNLGDALLAIQYSVQQGARIINASWGGAECNYTFRQALLDFADKNILFVSAAGNEGKDLDYYSVSPASFNLPFQITVAAATTNDLMANWSNRSFNLVHLAAPGENILSTIPQNKTAIFSGTSMAAPMVSGAAALLWSAYPEATALQIKNALMESVDVYSSREYKVSTRGRLNVYKAFENLQHHIK